jgi:hypothetical protein
MERLLLTGSQVKAEVVIQAVAVGQEEAFGLKLIHYPEMDQSMPMVVLPLQVVAEPGDEYRFYTPLAHFRWIRSTYTPEVVIVLVLEQCI